MPGLASCIAMPITNPLEWLMSGNCNDNNNLNASLDENVDLALTKKLKKSPLSRITVDLYLCDRVSFFSAGLYGLISSLSHKSGRCFMSTKEMALRLRTSHPTIKRHLKELEDAKLIYRNTYTYFNKSKLLGKKRFIVTAEHAPRYWDEYLNHEKIPLEVRFKYLEFWGWVTDKPKNIPPDKEYADEGLIDEGSFDEQEIKEKFTKDQSDPCSKKDQIDPSSLLHKESDRERAIVVSSSLSAFQKEMLVEAKKSIKDKEVLAYAQDYLEINESAIKMAGNPAAYFVWALKKGIAKDVVDKQRSKKKENDDETEKVNVLFKNANLFKDLFIGTCWHSKITVSKSNVIITFKQNGKVTSTAIDFKDPDFYKKLNIIKTKMNKYLSESNENISN